MQDPILKCVTCLGASHFKQVHQSLALALYFFIWSRSVLKCGTFRDLGDMGRVLWEPKFEPKKLRGPLNENAEGRGEWTSCWALPGLFYCFLIEDY